MDDEPKSPSASTKSPEDEASSRLRAAIEVVLLAGYGVEVPYVGLGSNAPAAGKAIIYAISEGGRAIR